ncbi:recombinase family protein, partial [Nocardioides aquiterrae]
MSEPRSAAIYARISSDQDGTRAGVGRQVEDCRKLAADLGWTVAAEYVDNDLSAYTGKHRPEYQRMMADLAEGLIDAVLVYNIDRLTRRPAELEAFSEAIQAAGVRHVRFVTGDANMLTDDGMLHLRILGAFAAKESANISRRIMRKMEQVAAEGRPHGGSQRPFGYERDMVTVIPTEAEILRTVVARF